jgi:hypothetical protein
MRIYLDDDSVDPALLGMLGKAGHDVLRPADIGMIGADDVVHFTRAIREDRALLSGNHDDFQALHLLILEARGRHSGLLIVRKDNDASRDMTPRGVVVAIGKLTASGIDLRKEFVILNHWR